MEELPTPRDGSVLEGDTLSAVLVLLRGGKLDCRLGGNGGRSPGVDDKVIGGAGTFVLPEGAAPMEGCGDDDKEDGMESIPASVPPLVARPASESKGVLISAGSTAKALPDDPSLLMAICRKPPAFAGSNSDPLACCRCCTDWVIISESSETDDANVLDSSLDWPDGEAGAEDCC